MISNLLFLLLFFSTPVHGKRTSTLYTYDRGSYAYHKSVPLLRSYSYALPEVLIPYLIDEAKKTHAWEKGARDKNLKHSKAATNWASMENILNPRTASEMAVNLLLQYAFPKGEYPKGGIGGGEWWVQLRNTNENIGFHVDKDEGVASEEQWMKMPVLSTVTYLTNEGGPTLVLDQSSNRGGNKQTPELPTKGILVYPKKNRHILFRGNLQHGVVGEFGGKRATGVGRRITFLVNWWDKKPMSPYCMSISDQVAENHIKSDLLKSSGIMSSMFGGDKVLHFWNTISKEFQKKTNDAPPEAEKFIKIDVPEDGSSRRRRFDIQVPPTKRYNFPVPHDIDYSYQQEILQFDWDTSDVQGILRNLDLRNNMCMHLFNNIPGLKVVLFRDDKDKKRTIKFDLDVAYQVAKPYVDLEESTGTVIYSANAKNTNRDMLHFAKKNFAIKPSKRNKSIFPAVGALLVTRKKRKRYFQMPEHLPIEPEVILNWIGQIETKQKEVLQHEVRNGKLRKRKEKRKRKRKKKRKEEEGEYEDYEL
jgi:hypothetical protein